VRELTVSERFIARITIGRGVYFRYTARQEILKVTPDGFGDKLIAAPTRAKEIEKCLFTTFS
jgi:hypothetical protein